MAGTLGAPATVLDQLSAAADGRRLPHTSLLPFRCVSRSRDELLAGLQETKTFAERLLELSLRLFEALDSGAFMTDADRMALAAGVERWRARNCEGAAAPQLDRAADTIGSGAVMRISGSDLAFFFVWFPKGRASRAYVSRSSSCSHLINCSRSISRAHLSAMTGPPRPDCQIYPRCKGPNVNTTLATEFVQYCFCWKCWHVWSVAKAPVPPTRSSASPALAARGASHVSDDRRPL